MNAYLGLALVILVVVALITIVKHAYTNGVTDGYGAATEPHNPGYKKARSWLIQHMAYRWPALTEPHTGLTTEQEAAIHIIVRSFLSKRDQGRVMGAIRDVLRSKNS